MTLATHIRELLCPQVPIWAAESRGMAERYLADPTKMATDWMVADGRVGVLECRHFFSGAVAHRDGSIAVSPTSVGLAFNVKSEVREDLLDNGRTSPLRSLREPPIQRDYLLSTHSTIRAHEATQLIVDDDIQG